MNSCGVRKGCVVFGTGSRGEEEKVESSEVRAEEDEHKLGNIK